METVIRPFSALTVQELYAIYRLRVAVFVVEQHCPYQEVDDLDPHAVHIWLRENGQMLAYLRVIPPDVLSPDAHIGRVTAVRRRCGLGTAIMQAGIRYIRESGLSDRIVLDSQLYAKGLYAKCGFVQASDPFPPLRRNSRRRAF